MVIQQQPMQSRRAVGRERSGERARAVIVDIARIELDSCELGIDLRIMRAGNDMTSMSGFTRAYSNVGC